MTLRNSMRNPEILLNVNHLIYREKEHTLGMIFFHFLFFGWGPALVFQVWKVSGSIKQVERGPVFLLREHGPLHWDCNTIHPLWDCKCYSAKLCLKTSFIIHRLQTEIIFDNLCRKQAAFWLLASRLKGGNTCSLSDRAPGESIDNLLTSFPSESAQMFLWNKTPALF